MTHAIRCIPYIVRSFKYTQLIAGNRIQSHDADVVIVFVATKHIKTFFASFNSAENHNHQLHNLWYGHVYAFSMYWNGYDTQDTFHERCPGVFSFSASSVDCVPLKHSSIIINTCENQTCYIVRRVQKTNCAVESYGWTWRISRSLWSSTEMPRIRWEMVLVFDCICFLFARMSTADEAYTVQ